MLGSNRNYLETSYAPTTWPPGAIGNCKILFVDDGSQDDSYPPGARAVDWTPADGRPLPPRQTKPSRNAKNGKSGQAVRDELGKQI